ncbi:unnamed protein product, partial [marine sediment metagenome]
MSLTLRLDIEGMGEKTEQPASELNSEQRNQLKATLLRSSEG